MIKKLLTIATVVLSVAVNAQTGKSVKSQAINADSNLPSVTAKSSAAPGCIQITTQTSSSVVINTSSPCNTVTNAFGGYVNGTNCYGDLEKANYFDAPLFTAVTSPSVSNVAVGFFRANGTNTIGTKGTTGTVSLTIYNGTYASGPTTVVGSTVATLAQIIASQTLTTNSFFTYTFTFGTPLAVSAGFFASVSVPTAVGDTVVVFNQSGATTNFAWEKQTPSTWVNMSSPSGWGTGYKGSLSIYPNVCGTNITTGISKNLGLSKDITIMPNPSTGLVNVAITLPNYQNVSLTVTNALGQVIVNNNYNSVITENISLDLTNQSNGVYFVTVSNGTDKMVQRLILNK